jgi:RNA polymerase sigma factor (sigma-70 family)
MPLFRTRPDLIAAFREGRREAMEQVYRHYVRSVDAYLRALAFRNEPSLVRPATVSDLIQETFVKAFSEKARLAYDPQRDYSPYLKTIARNCLIDARRARGREVLEADLCLPADALAESAADDRLYDPKVATILRVYIRDLPSSLRGVYEQRYVLGHSQHESCSVLGVTRRNLRTSEERLKRGLRNALKAGGVFRRDVAVPFAAPLTASRAAGASGK